MENTESGVQTERRQPPAAAPRRRKSKRNRRTRLLQRRLLVAGVAVGIFVGIFSLGAAWRGGRSPGITEPAIAAQLEPLAALSATSYHFTNTERFENIEDFYGWDASEHDYFILSYAGTVTAAVSTNGVKVEIDGKNINITLPEAQITSDVIASDSLSVYNTRQGLFEQIELTDFAGFQDNQKAVVIARATEGGLLFDASDKAKAAATVLVQNLIGGAGEYDIAVK